MSWIGHRFVVVALIAATCCLAPDLRVAQAEKVRVKIPLVLPSDARKGKSIYEDRCSRCHGRTLSGTDKGPALILYEKSHHGDGMFLKAVREGVRAHHWEHGDMPPLAELTDDQIGLVIRYVREIQKFNEND